MHGFVEQFDTEVEDAVHAARVASWPLSSGLSRRSAICTLVICPPIKQAGTSPKPRGLIIEPDFVLAYEGLDAAPLAVCLSRIHEAIVALEPFDGVRFDRKPLVLRNAGGKAESRQRQGQRKTALAALELAGRGA